MLRVALVGDDEKLLRGAFNKYGHMGDAASQAQLLLANSELRRAVGRDVGENPVNSRFSAWLRDCLSRHLSTTSPL